MKANLVVVVLVAIISAAPIAEAEDVVLDSADANGHLTFLGALAGTTARVEWAASLTEPSRTNWNSLTNVVVTNITMTTDIPMFYRVVGVPDTVTLSNGLVGFYPFSGNANDQSGNGNNGIVNGAVLTSDRFGNPTNAYSFTNAYIDCGNGASLELTNDFTISIRFYSESWTNQNVSGLISKRDSFGSYDWEIGYDRPTQSLNFWAQGSASVVLTVPGPYSTNLWQMMTVTRTGSLWSVYVDGVPKGSITTNFNIGTGDRVRIGTLGAGTTDYFRGKLDDVRLYNRCLPSDEIRLLYKVGN